VNRDFSIGTPFVEGRVYHAGMLFLIGAGYWGRVERFIQIILKNFAVSGSDILNIF